VLLSAMIGTAGLIAARGTGLESPPPRTQFQDFPAAVAGWRAAGNVPIDAEARDVLRADDYLDRNYRAPSGRLVNLYVAYYASQRQGEAIHSPQNCLPGSGWQPVESGIATLQIDGRPLPVNRYVIERHGARQLAYYWYQGRGRAVANEFANKFWLIVDAARLHRSDGALVRVMTTVDAATAGSAEQAGAEFSGGVFPVLERFVP
jgi:EpsI family protein